MVRLGQLVAGDACMLVVVWIKLTGLDAIARARLLRFGRYFNNSQGVGGKDGVAFLE